MESKLEKALKWIVNILKKHNVPFQIAGGFAAHIYGAKRSVNDIDLDIPEEKFKTILPDIEKYITFGPDRLKDEKWDLDLIVLNYEGQMIDISGAYKTKIYNEKNKTWESYPAQFETAQIKTIFEIEVYVMNPKDLMEYKKILNGEHQKIDIEAVKNYLVDFSQHHTTELNRFRHVR